MWIALVSLLALVIAIAASSVRVNLNTGILALAFAYLVGVFGAGLSFQEISTGWPTDLFLMLFSVLLLFELVDQTGALTGLTHKIVRLVHGKPAYLPFLFFGLTFLLAAIGPGNIAATAIMAPLGMAIAGQVGISPLLMAIVIVTGANAGAFSPLAPTGIINVHLMQGIGLSDSTMSLQIFLVVAGIQSLTALAAYFLFGGHRAGREAKAAPPEIPGTEPQLTTSQTLILLALAGLVLVVVFFQVPIGVGALVLAVTLAILGIGDLEKAIKGLPWSVLLLVTGVSVLVSVMDKTGGIDLATTLLAQVVSPASINAMLAFSAGVVSIYSSSSGVVLPTFLPLIPGIMEKAGCGSLPEMIIAIDIGSHMVDVSPLSSLGALCLAAAVVENKTPLFRGLLIWGLVMAVAGAGLAFVFLDVL